jgi:Bacterial cadherin-like domain
MLRKPFPCGTLAYQWSFGTNTLADQTNATLTVGSVQLTNAGDYLVIVSSAAGMTTSAVAVLTVNQTPVAADTSARVTQNQLLILTYTKLLSLCSDPDGDPLSVVSAGPTSTNGGAPDAILSHHLSLIESNTRKQVGTARVVRGACRAGASQAVGDSCWHGVIRAQRGVTLGTPNCRTR